MRTFNLFISHSWTYTDAYEKFVGLLNNRSHFSYKNYSVPKENPITGARTDAQLKAAIEAQIRPSSVVIIMAGKYATYSKWIDIEIEIATSMGKPIVAVTPWGAKQISTTVSNAADVVAGWNTESIVSAIREVA
jgi:hypothetical protein